MNRPRMLSLHCSEVPTLRIDFPDIFTDEVIDEVFGDFTGHNVVMFGIPHSSYRYYRYDTRDKVIWWDIYLWDEDYLNNDLAIREEPDRVGRMQACSVNVAEQAGIPVITFFSRNLVSERDLETIPYRECYEWTGDYIDSYAKTCKTLRDFCRNEIPED